MKNMFFLMAFLFSCITYGQNDSIYKASMQDKINKLTLAKDFKGAASAYTDMIVDFPNDLRLVRDRGIMYILTGNYREALPDFTKLIESNYKNMSEAYFYRGMCKYVVKIDGACEDLTKSKNLGYTTDWKSFQLLCPTLSND